MCGHVQRRENDCYIRTAADLSVHRRRIRRVPVKIWTDSENVDTGLRRLKGEDVQDRNKWRRLLHSRGQFHEAA